MRTWHDGKLVVSLQWSRANDGAETARNLADKLAIEGLQWSRANDGAETPFPEKLQGLAVKLQWSRANDGAETVKGRGDGEQRERASMEPRQ